MLRRNQKQSILFVAGLFVFLFVLSQTPFFSALRFKVVDAVSLPVRFFSFPLRELKKILFYHRTFEGYKSLRKQVDVLETRLVGMDEVLKENTRLEGLLEFKRRSVYSSVAASVIGRDPSNWHSSLVIDKGTDDSIGVGMPVINALGVVGKVVEAGKNSAKIMLLTDPQFSVAALIQRPRESGLVSGTLGNVCRLRYLNADSNVRVGDKVITSKLSSAFPDGLLVGTVTAVHEGTDTPSIEATVETAVAISQIEEVLVILK